MALIGERVFVLVLLIPESTENCVFKGIFCTYLPGPRRKVQTIVLLIMPLSVHTNRHTHQYHDSAWPRGLGAGPSENMRVNGAPRRSRGSPLASIFFSWICKPQPIIGLCQLDMQRQTIYGVQWIFTCIQLSNLCMSNIKGRSNVCLSNTVY